MEGDPIAARAGLAPRVASTLLGCWLFASVFLWPHNGADGFDALITGILVVTVAPIAIWTPALRLGNAYLAIWLFVTTLFFRHETLLTPFNDVLVSVAILLLALVPGRPRPWTPSVRRA